MESLTGKIWMSFRPARLAQSASGFKSVNSPTPKLFSLRRLKTGIATPAPRQLFGGQPDETVVDDDVFFRRGGFGQNPVVAVFKANELRLLDIINAVFVLHRQFFTAQINLRGQKIFAGNPVQQERRGGAPVAERRATTDEAKRLAFLQQRSLDLECVARAGRRQDADFGEIGPEQNVLERLGVKGVFDGAGVVPRINDQNFVVLERRRIDDTVAAPILNGRTVGVPQNVIVSYRGVGNPAGGEVQCGLPEFGVEILERQRPVGATVAEQRMIADEPERLSNFGAEAKSKNQFHVLLKLFQSRSRFKAKSLFRPARISRGGKTGFQNRFSARHRRRRELFPFRLF